MCVKVLRPLTVFGYDDAPHGSAEVGGVATLFVCVKVLQWQTVLGCNIRGGKV